jgi:hypothetical protein
MSAAAKEMDELGRNYTWGQMILRVLDFQPLSIRFRDNMARWCQLLGNRQVGKHGQIDWNETV